MSDLDAARAISAAFAEIQGDQRDEARAARRRELLAELQKIPSGSELTSEQNAMFDEYEALCERRDES